MNATPVRGVVLVALAALLGFLILRGVTEREQVPIATTAPIVAATPTPTPGVAADGAAVTGDGTAALPTAPPVVDTSTARPNAQVSVLVANGTDVSGQAGRLTDVLRNQGFNTRQPKNADTRPTSVIYYRPGFEVEAQVVRDILQTTTPIAPMPVPDPVVGTDIDLGPVDVFVLVGGDALSTS